MKLATIKNIKPRKTLKLFIQEGHESNRNIEIRAIIDKKYIVFKYYINDKTKSLYELRHIGYFQLLIDAHNLYIK